MKFILEEIVQIVAVFMEIAGYGLVCTVEPCMANTNSKVFAYIAKQNQG